MRHVTTIICCIAFAIAGGFLALTDKSELSFDKRQTLSAATIPEIQVAKLPLDVQLDLGKQVKLTDSSVVKKDTVFIERPKIIVVHTKSPKANTPKGVTDVAWMMLKPGQMFRDTVNNKGILDREEKTRECDVGSSKESTIQLTVDGKIVYSKDVNHSTEGSK